MRIDTFLYKILKLIPKIYVGLIYISKEKLSIFIGSLEKNN